MKSFDVFFAEEDTHRIRPLIRFLEQQELEIRQHTRPKKDPSSPFLVIVSESYAGNAWLSELVESDEAVAVLLGHGTPPNAGRTADLSSWPARSADRALAGLAKWMKSPVGSPASAGSANSTRKKPPGRKSQRRQNIAGILVIVGVFALIAWLPSLTESTQSEAADERSAEPAEWSETTQNSQQPGTASAVHPLRHAAVDHQYTGGTTHIGHIARAARFHCARRWSLGGPISQCWIEPEQPLSLDPLYLSGPLRPSA